MLAAISVLFPTHRECTVYALVTEIPAVFLLYDSKLWSGAFLLLIFGVSVWNGGGFYIEVFGRKSVSSHHICICSVYKVSSAGSRENWRPFGKNLRKQRHDQKHPLALVERRLFPATTKARVRMTHR